MNLLEKQQKRVGFFSVGEKNPKRLGCSCHDRNQHVLSLRHRDVTQTTTASIYSVTMASVLVCTCDLIFGQRPDVLPLPPAVCLRAAGGLQAPPTLWSSHLRVCAVLLGVHHRVRGDPGGGCIQTFYCLTTANNSKVNPFFFLSKTFFVGTMTWRQRFRVYIQDVWNKCDLTAIILFIIGLICR